MTLQARCPRAFGAWLRLLSKHFSGRDTLAHLGHTGPAWLTIRQALTAAPDAVIRYWTPVMRTSIDRQSLIKNQHAAENRSSVP